MTSNDPGSMLFTADTQVRWRDLDAFNHVNNANYLTYLEEARLQWLAQVPGSWHDENCMPVLAASTINYRLPIEWPAELRIKLYCQRLGNRSLTIAHRILNPDGDKLYSDGHVVIVWIDPCRGTTLPVPKAIGDAIAAAN